MTAVTDDIPKPTDRLPWALTAAAVVAMAALYLTAERFLGLIPCALALVLSQFTALRLPRSRTLAASVRAILFAVITIIIGFPEESFPQWYMKPSYTNLLGCILAAEVAIRSWEHQDAARTGDPRGVMLILSALVLAAASNTFERTHIQALTPVYILLILVVLRGFHRPVARRANLVALRVIAALLAVGLGFGIVSAITRYDQALTSWAIDLLNSKRSRSSEIGLSGSPRLTSTNDPSPSMDRVLLIDGARSERHLRALSFDTYQDRQWKPTLRERPFFQADPRELRGQSPQGQRLVLTRIGDTLDLLPMPLSTADVSCTAALERDEAGALRHQEEALTGIASAYEVTVPADEQAQGPLCQPLNAEQRQRALALPDDLDPKVVELSKAVAGAGDGVSRVLKLAMHLRSSHAYSLTYHPGEAEPLSDFILNRRAAHCQYFGSALVVMARAAGVPARFVIGYYAHEPYGDGQMVVRSRDAHAWAECWIDGVGWITLDATPAAGRPDLLFKPASRWRRAWESILDIPRILRDWLAGFSRDSLIRMFIAAAVAVPVVGIVRFIIGRIRRRRQSRTEQEYPAPGQELVALGRRFERWLKRAGHPCEPNTTWREHVSGMNPLCLRFVDAYDQARFGARDGEALSEAVTLLSQLEPHHTTEHSDGPHH